MQGTPKNKARKNTAAVSAIMNKGSSRKKNITTSALTLLTEFSIIHISMLIYVPQYLYNRKNSVNTENHILNCVLN